MKSSGGNGIRFLHSNWFASEAVLEPVYASDARPLEKAVAGAEVQSITQNTQVLFLWPRR